MKFLVSKSRCSWDICLWNVMMSGMLSKVRAWINWGGKWNQSDTFSFWILRTNMARIGKHTIVNINITAVFCQLNHWKNHSFLGGSVSAKPFWDNLFDGLQPCWLTCAHQGEKRALYASYRSELLTINGGDVSISNRPQSPGMVWSYDC